MSRDVKEVKNVKVEWNVCIVNPTSVRIFEILQIVRVSERKNSLMTSSHILHVCTHMTEAKMSNGGEEEEKSK